MGTQGWLPWQRGPLPALSQGALSSSDVILVSGVNPTGLSDFEIWLGYGLGNGSDAENEMIAAKRYRRIYP